MKPHDPKIVSVTNYFTDYDVGKLDDLLQEGLEDQDSPDHDDHLDSISSRLAYANISQSDHSCNHDTPLKRGFRKKKK